jgi:calcineurin-like phosphoesterase family protein
MPTGSNIKKFEAAIVLNEVAAFIWKQLENSVSKEDLLHAILDEFEVDEQTASNDLDAILEKLAGLELLQVG